MKVFGGNFISLHVHIKRELFSAKVPMRRTREEKTKENDFTCQQGKRRAK